MAKTGATGAITRFPIPTVLVFLLLTAYFVSQSGFLDNTRFDDDLENPALNVNGDLEVYLPEGSRVAELIGKVEEDWSTNVMVVYIESTKGNNITNQRILQEISYVERLLNPQLSDDSDDVIYILSLSTVLKEVNSSAPRIREAIRPNWANSGVPTTRTTIARPVIWPRNSTTRLRSPTSNSAGPTRFPVRPPSTSSSARCTTTTGNHLLA